jgi:Na+/melibiose symporter-like transporter
MDMSAMATEKKACAGAVPERERMSYFLGALGQGMMYAVMSSYISDFYLNVLGLGAMFVFWLTLLARFWDSVNDPLMGMLMDRLRPRGGKMRPYLRWLPFPIAALTALMFYKPDIPSGSTLLMAWAAAAYVLWDMLYTIGDIPFWSIPNVMTPNAGERGKIISVGRTVNGVGSAVPMALVMALGPLLAARVADNARVDELKYLLTALICSGAGFFLFFQASFRLRERVPLPKEEKTAGGQGAFPRVLRCRPLMLTVLMGILAGGRYIYQAGAAHMARYVFYSGDLEALYAMAPAEQTRAMQSSFSMVSTVLMATMGAGMFVTMLIVPTLIGKYSYKRLLIASCLLGGAAGTAMYFVGYGNFYAVIPCLLLCSVPVGVINVVAYAMVGDSLDYMEWETGRRDNGLGLACQSFVTKLGNALATAGVVLSYSMVNLTIGDQGGNLLAVARERLPAVRQGMFTVMTLLPAFSLLVCTVPMLFYDLTGAKKERVVRELAERRARAAG